MDAVICVHAFGIPHRAGVQQPVLRNGGHRTVATESLEL